MTDLRAAASLMPTDPIPKEDIEVHEGSDQRDETAWEEGREPKLPGANPEWPNAGEPMSDPAPVSSGSTGR